ncbi:V-set domain-containing T-cell activation inhibitor 1 [Microcaecilia unicolor]|uniref:V-set domain-containing T-cell activation inhibitor 1 n=1 Tax=Microcaecilia unicolor TaxID=1415580 RepID=A0A6P7YDK2_9AMPH|nr:V-set domain-containing T-cell activation inhibitor 1 [Microcaecilia unicolor]
MASVGQIIFWSMIAIIIILAGAIALIIGLAVSGNNSATVSTSTSVGRIGDDGVLYCSFVADIKQNSIIEWEKEGLSGLVLKYDKGKEDKSNQNPIFNGRTQFFLNQVVIGNASLLLKNVKLSDTGIYKCTVTTSAGRGQATMDFRVGAYSYVDVKNSTGNTLQCTAESWYPKPSVRWFNISSGEDLTEFSETTFEKGFDPVLAVVSLLKNVTHNTPYSCVIENQIARGNSDIIISGKQ